MAHERFIQNAPLGLAGNLSAEPANGTRHHHSSEIKITYRGIELPDGVIKVAPATINGEIATSAHYTSSDRQTGTKVTLNPSFLQQGEPYLEYPADLDQKISAGYNPDNVIFKTNRYLKSHGIPKNTFRRIHGKDDGTTHTYAADAITPELLELKKQESAKLQEKVTQLSTVMEELKYELKHRPQE